MSPDAEHELPVDKLRELVEQSDRDIADYVMGMYDLMDDELDPQKREDWTIRRDFWMAQISRW
jgi:hypothetical protein